MLEQTLQQIEFFNFDFLEDGAKKSGDNGLSFLIFNFDFLRCLKK